MELDRRTALMALAALPGLGPVNLRRLDEALGGKVEDLLAMSPGERAVWCSPRVVDELGNWRNYFNPDRVLAALDTMGADFVTCEEEAYPGSLRHFPDRPIGLYRFRKDHLIQDKNIAVVGTRRPSSYGRRVARDFSRGLAERGYGIISGLAEGIDTEAHRAALSMDCRTLAVLGGGLNRCYPSSNRSLMDEISLSGGVWTEFPMWRRADRRSFPQRNRIVAGMSDAVVVIESGPTGGSLITARFGSELGKPVYVVPGRIDSMESEGCHQLIRDGAQLVTSVEDILADLNYLPGPLRNLRLSQQSLQPAHKARPELETIDGAIWDFLKQRDVAHADQLADGLEISVAELSGHLLGMELDGHIVRRIDGFYELA